MIGKISDIVGQKGIVFLREDGWFLVLLTILNLPIFIQEFYSQAFPIEESLKNALPNFWQGLCFILLLCVAMNFLFAKHRRIKIFLRTILIIFFAISLLTDIFTLRKFGYVLHVNTIQIIMGTNPLTVKEFLSNYVLTFPIIFGVIFFVAALVALVKGLQKFFNTRSEERLNC